MARLKDLHHVGPFFSTDAGGAPNSAYAGIGATEGVPESTNIPGFQDFLGTISTMQVPTYGMFTPWGKLVQAPTVLGYDVQPLSSAPETNIIAFEFSVVAQLLSSLGFGQPNFLTIISSLPLSPEQVSAALAGTPYRLFDDGLAVYDQNDPSGIPAMYFMYWIVLRDPGDPQGGAGGVGAAAQGLGAALCFGQQVPVEQTTSRAPPQVSPSLVATSQFPSYFGGAAAPPPPNGAMTNGGTQQPPPNGAQQPATEQAAVTGPSYVGLYAVGLLAAVVGYAVSGGKKRRRGR